jgi:small GTP-binding protein
MGRGTVKRIVMIGLDGAGKTTLLYRVQTDSLINTNPTIGFNAELVEIDGTSVAIWDLGGQVTLRSLWSYYLKDATGLVFVIDSSDTSRLNEALRELEQVLAIPDLATCKAFLVLANKQDLPNAMNADLILQKMRSLKSFNFPPQNSDVEADRTPVDDLSEPENSSNGCTHFKVDDKNWLVRDCCAITGENVLESLSWLMQYSSV